MVPSKKMLSMLFVFLAILSQSLAHAAEVEVAYGRGKHGLNARTVRTLVRVSARRWSKETGRRIRIKRFYRYRSGPILPVMSLAEFSPGNLPYPGPTLVVLPPVLDSIKTTRNDAWIFGHAVVCGSQGFVAVTNKDRFGRNRLSHAEVAIAHELGHILGAQHDEGLMHPAPLHQLEGWGFRYEITDRSIREVRSCRKQRHLQ